MSERAASGAGNSPHEHDAAQDRVVVAPPREECEDLLYTIIDALGYMEPGRGDREYDEARKAIRSLRDILNLDD